MPTVPNIFTSTPIEGFILALFWRAQVALAAMMEATAIFRLALFIALAWAIVLGFLRMVSHKHHAAQHFFHMCYRVGLVYVALAFTTQAGSANFASLSTSQKQWGAMARVQSNPQLGPALTQPSDALYWYLVLFKGMNQLATAMQTSIASAFSVPPEAMNSRFVARQLSRMSVMSLGPATAQAFDALNESCLDTSFQTSVAGDLTNMKDMYDLTERYDGVRLDDLRVPTAELEAALAGISPLLREALEAARANILAFHRETLHEPGRCERFQAKGRAQLVYAARVDG